MHRGALALLVATVACGGSDGGVDAIEVADADTAADAALDARTTVDAAPDGGGAADAGDARAAVVVDCREVVGGGMIGHTAEITDTDGYVPTGDATMPVGYATRYAYADGGNGVTHTIVSGPGGAAPAPDGLFASDPVVDHGDSICIRFDAPGTYPYHCGEHPEDEIGLITVTD